ncbi:hypothetical protein CAC42_4831 [Sphaceloma murrayae]|uniref:Pyrimidine 5'-nucleotidase n=1 Tax=Sphaceloma murrayae TaxID=2082308 RepID=A0A2K1QP29_9PEZI|nr:hypothetical protein CAC42_4831 [Sphaceloma murrayae]
MTTDGRAIFFFDIDNCLYPKSKRVHDFMGELIDKYFQSHLSLSQKDANELHMRYYKDYGLAIEGLVRHHKVDPLEYNAQVDDALPLEKILEPNPQLRSLIADIDTSKVKLWLFTNAYITHGKRVVQLLGIDDLFEGITYCDYGARPLLCKPTKEMYEKAMKEADVTDVSQCYYVDDSGLNVRGGKAFGWKSVHLVEHDAQPPPEPTGHYQIRELEELRTIFPHLFKST